MQEVGHFIVIVGLQLKPALLATKLLPSASTPWFCFHQLLVQPVGECCHLEQ